MRPVVGSVAFGDVGGDVILFDSYSQHLANIGFPYPYKGTWTKVFRNRWQNARARNAQVCALSPPPQPLAAHRVACLHAEILQRRNFLQSCTLGSVLRKCAKMAAFSFTAQERSWRAPSMICEWTVWVRRSGSDFVFSITGLAMIQLYALCFMHHGVRIPTGLEHVL